MLDGTSKNKCIYYEIRKLRLKTQKKKKREEREVFSYAIFPH